MGKFARIFIHLFNKHPRRRAAGYLKENIGSFVPGGGEFNPLKLNF